MGKERQKIKEGGFTEGTGSGLHHIAIIEDEENSFSQREYKNLKYSNE